MGERHGRGPRNWGALASRKRSPVSMQKRCRDRAGRTPTGFIFTSALAVNAGWLENAAIAIRCPSYRMLTTLVCINLFPFFAEFYCGAEMSL
jgi:hypothetical protein